MQLRTEIEINAPPSKVWEVLTDTARFDEWNPLLSDFEGTLEEGELVRMSVAQPRGRSTRHKFRVLKVEPERELRWRSRMLARWLFQGEHFFQLSETATGTKLVQGEDFQGMIAKRYSVLLPSTARGFALMNAALKDRAEGRPPRRKKLGSA